MKKTLAACAMAVALVLGTSAHASAESAVAAPRAWVPVFYFGTQTYCNQAGMLGQQIGVLTPGRWTCDSGWLLSLQGEATAPTPPPAAPPAAPSAL
jgi:hypothetical protein